jgi:uracil-DNA glycosylase family 4
LKRVGTRLDRNKLNELNGRIVNENRKKEIVLGDGNVNSKILLIGEAPGAKEVELKRPFVGQAGKQLQEFLDMLELDRSEIYVTNTVKFRPTNKSGKTGREINRAPAKNEIDHFKKYLFEEIDIIKPKVIVTLGNVALRVITERDDVKIGDFHGKEVKVIINNSEHKLFPLYHPASIIYNRGLKDDYVRDVINLKNMLRQVKT